MVRHSLLLSAVFAFGLGTSGTAHGQLVQDLSQELRDEARLSSDMQRLRYDLNTGNTAAALGDLNRVRRDEQQLQYDQQRLQYDLSYYPTGYTYQRQALVPHPQYPGYYYYPSNPAQLYYYPSQTQATTTAVTPNPTPNSGGGTTVTPNPTPRTAWAIEIQNPTGSGLTLSYQVDGVSYSTQSGSFQRVSIGPGSIIVFDRGDGFGTARYGVSHGTYEFSYTDQGWMIYKTLATLVNRTDPGLASNSTPRSANSSSTSTTAGNAATTSANSSNNTPPPPPTPVVPR